MKPQTGHILDAERSCVPGPGFMCIKFLIMIHSNFLFLCMYVYVLLGVEPKVSHQAVCPVL